MARKEDRRVKMTKRLLKESLINLLASKEIWKITITEICESADINRSTFYTHYNDQFDLLRDIENEYSKRVTEYISTPLENYDDLHAFLTSLLQFFVENKAISKILFSERNDVQFLNYLIKQLYDETILMAVNPYRDKEKIKYGMQFLISGSVGILLKWAREDFEVSPEQIATMLTNFIIPIVNHQLD